MRGILEAHHCAFWFPLLTSYTIMSYPNLLEYHLLSSCPLVDSSPSVLVFQPRFGYALPYLPYGQMFLVYFSLGKDLLPCFKSFRVALVFFFLLKSAVLLQRDFHLGERHFNLLTLRF
jgi:hypothetical protein